MSAISIVSPKESLGNTQVGKLSFMLKYISAHINETWYCTN